MGKTRDDEAYERGFEAGKAGGILDDTAQNLSRPLDFTKQDEIYNKGYREGAEHRYDSAGCAIFFVAGLVVSVLLLLLSFT